MTTTTATAANLHSLFCAAFLGLEPETTPVLAPAAQLAAEIVTTRPASIALAGPVVTDAEMADFIAFLGTVVRRVGTESLRYERGRRFIKVITGSSVYAFVEIATGDIYKPASWAAPAKHVRGNIRTHRGCCGAFSIAYLR